MIDTCIFIYNIVTNDAYDLCIIKNKIKQLKQKKETRSAASIILQGKAVSTEIKCKKKT